MPKLPVPSPTDFQSLLDWARAMYAYMSTDVPVDGRVYPQAVLLPHQQVNTLSRATQDGLLMYDPSEAKPVISLSNVWVNLAVEGSSNTFTDLTVTGSITLSGNIVNSVSDDLLGISGDTTISTGANALWYGAGHATEAGDTFFRVGTASWLWRDHSANTTYHYGNATFDGGVLHIDSTNDRVGVNVVPSIASLEVFGDNRNATIFTRDSATTSGKRPVGQWSHTSSGTVNNGFGLRVEYVLEAADGSNYDAGQVQVEWDDATARSSSFIIRNRQSDVVTEAFKVDGSGNATTSGTVNGRNISTDGTKLDGIEANADVTDTANVTAAGALMDSEVDEDIKTLSLPANTTISSFGASLVDDTTALAARTTLGVGTGDTPDFTGVTFGGAGSTLQYYDEGTWTPVLADASTGGNTATVSATAVYTRIGRMVFCDVRFLNIDTTGLTAGNDLYLRGLPFTVKNTSFGGSPAVITRSVSHAGTLSFWPNPDSTYGRFAEVASGVAVVDYLLVSEITSGVSDMWFGFDYHV